MDSGASTADKLICSSFNTVSPGMYLNSRDIDFKDFWNNGSPAFKQKSPKTM
jgi:hypothetical protein